MAPSCYPLPAPVPLSLHANRCKIFPYFQETSQVMLELNQNRSVVSPQARIAVRNQQSRKLLIALGLLLAALVAVLINDRQFWFGTEQATIESDMPETQPVAQTAPAPAVIPAKPVAVSAARKPVSTPKIAASITTPASLPRLPPSGPLCLLWMWKWLPAVSTARFILPRPPRSMLRRRRWRLPAFRPLPMPPSASPSPGPPPFSLRKLHTGRRIRCWRST